MNKFTDPFKKMRLITRLILIAGFLLCIPVNLWVLRTTLRPWLKPLNGTLIVICLIMLFLLIFPFKWLEGLQRLPYEPQLKQLSRLTAAGEEKMQRISELVNALFGSTSLTAAKFQGAATQVLQDLKDNELQALRAVQAFGSDPVKQDRIQVLADYVTESGDIVSRLDQLLLMLVRFDQNRDRDSEKAAADELQRIMEQLHLYR